MSDSVRHRVELNSTLLWNLHDLWPELRLPGGALFSTKWSTRIGRRLARAEQTMRVRIAREELRSLRELTLAINRLKREITDLLEQIAPQLLTEPGFGPLIAAKHVGEIAGAQRFSTSAKLARAAGVAPIPASSGNTQRHRLDQGGNRQINAALHRVIVTRARSLRVIARRVMRRVGVHLGPVHGDHLDAHQSSVATEPQHVGEKTGDRALVADAEARDRGVVGHPVGGDHAERDIVLAAPLDPPRRPLPGRVGVQQQRQHHHRVTRRATPPVLAIRRIKRPEVERLDGVEHEPRHVALGQPLTQARRQQQLLLTITRQEFCGMPGIVLTAPDGPGLCDSHRALRQCARGTRA